MERKEFIKTCGLACLGGLSLSLLLESCNTSNYFAQHTISANQFTIKKTEFVEMVKGVQTFRKFVLLKTDRSEFPICVFRINEEYFTALLMECTHKGCELKPHGDYLICPCHGSEFTNKGTVQNPPAEDNLKSFQTKTDHENIYVLV